MANKIEATFYGGSLNGLTGEVPILRREIVLGERTEAQDGKVAVVKAERYRLLCLRDDGGDYALFEEK